jgi:hypothetical protein
MTHGMHWTDAEYAAYLGRRPQATRPSYALSHDYEEQEQRALLRWADALAASQEPRLAWLYHIPNGGARSKATAGRLKAMGVKAGVPDLHLPVPSRGYHGTWLEMKAPGQRPTLHQWHWLEDLRTRGYHTGIYTTWHAAAAHLCWYLERDDLAQRLEGT